MELSTIDKNFAVNEITEGERIRYVIPHPAFSLRGIFYDSDAACFARVPTPIAEKVNEGVAALSKHTAGGRLCFKTDSKVLQITVSYQELLMMPHMPLTGSSGFTLFEKTADGEQQFVRNLMPIPTNQQGFIAETTLLGGEMREYILYFPLYNDVKELSLSLDKNACVERSSPYRKELPILYYGSSITQGGCASRPDHAYQAWISKWNGIDYINLGFSGSARGEDIMVDYLASIDCSLFVCDYDHNAPSVEHLKNTHFRLYERYRKIRPNMPILFITKPDITGDVNGEQRWKIIHDTYIKAKRSGDKNVYFLSGKKFYNNTARWEFSVDGCHPTDFGFYKMAKEIYKKMITIDEKYSGLSYRTEK